MPEFQTPVPSIVRRLRDAADPDTNIGLLALEAVVVIETQMQLIHAMGTEITRLERLQHG